MTTFQRYIRRQSPRDLVLNLIGAAQAAFDSGAMLHSLAITTDIGPSAALNLGDVGPVASLHEEAAVLQFLDLLEKNSAVQLHTARLQALPNKAYPRLSLQMSNDEGLAAVEIEFSDGHPASAFALKALTALADRFEMAPRAQLQLGAIESARQGVLSSAEVSLDALREQVAALGRHLAEGVQEAARFQQEWLQKTQEAASQERERLREEHEQRQRDLEATLATEREALQALDGQLSARAAALDLSEHKDARRKSHKEMVSRLQEEFGDKAKAWQVTEATKNKRKIIHALFSAACAGFVSLAAFGGFMVVKGSGDQPIWPFIMFFSSGVVGFASTITFYIRWAQSWFKEHSDREFFNVKLISDSIRAGWVVELLLEWHEGSERPKAFPDALLEKLSRELFTKPDHRDPVAHPAEDVAGKVPEVLTKLTEVVGKLTDGVLRAGRP